MIKFIFPHTLGKERKGVFNLKTGPSSLLSNPFKHFMYSSYKYRYSTVVTAVFFLFPKPLIHTPKYSIPVEKSKPLTSYPTVC